MSIEDERASLPSQGEPAHSASLTNVPDLDAIIASYLSDDALMRLITSPSTRSNPILAVDAQTWHYKLCRRACHLSPHGQNVPYRELWHILYCTNPCTDLVGISLDRTAKWVETSPHTESSYLTGHYTWHSSIVDILYHTIQEQHYSEDDEDRVQLPMDMALSAALGRGCTELYDMLQDGLDKPDVRWIEVIEAMAHDPERLVIGNVRRHNRTRPTFPTLTPAGFRRFYGRYWFAGLIDTTAIYTMHMEFNDVNDMRKHILAKCMMYPRHSAHMARVVTIVYDPAVKDHILSARDGLWAMLQSPLRPEDDTVGLINAYNAIKVVDPYVTIGPIMAIGGFLHTVRSKVGAETYVAQMSACMVSDGSPHTLTDVHDTFLGETSILTNRAYLGKWEAHGRRLMYAYIRGWYARNEGKGADTLSDKGIRYIVCDHCPRIRLTYDAVSAHIPDIIDRREGIILAAAWSPELVNVLYPSYGPLGSLMRYEDAVWHPPGQQVFYDGSCGPIRAEYQSIAKLILAMVDDPDTHPQSLEYVIDWTLPFANGVDVSPEAGTWTRELYARSEAWYIEDVQGPIIHHVVALATLHRKAVLDVRGELILRQLMRLFPSWAMETSDIVWASEEARLQFTRGIRMPPILVQAVAVGVYMRVLSDRSVTSGLEGD